MKKGCLILGATRDVSTCSENNYCSLLHLTNVTIGKGNVELVANVCPLEVFMAESYYSKQFIDGFMWLNFSIHLVVVEAVS